VGFWERALVGLAFLGGIWLPQALVLAASFGRRLRVIVAGLAAGCFFWLAWRGHLAWFPLRSEGELLALATASAALFAVSGVVILAACVRELRLRRDSTSLLLVLWIAGYWVHAVAFNWSISARALVPAAPAIALLAARAWSAERGNPARSASSRAALAGFIAASLALSLVLAHADQAQARAARRAARELVARYASEGRQPWFLGSWGFQHYAEAAGARKAERGLTRFEPGDRLIVSRGDLAATPAPPAELARVLERAQYRVPAIASTMSHREGAGFYSDQAGPMPYVFGAAPPQAFDVLEIRAPLRLPAEPDRSEFRRPSEGGSD
jgi:hypothetical protein